MIRKYRKIVLYIAILCAIACIGGVVASPKDRKTYKLKRDNL